MVYKATPFRVGGYLFKLTLTQNLLLNIGAGLEELHLTNKERGLLKRKFGKNWKKKAFGK